MQTNLGKKMSEILLDFLNVLKKSPHQTVFCLSIYIAYCSKLWLKGGFEFSLLLAFIFQNCRELIGLIYFIFTSFVTGPFFCPASLCPAQTQTLRSCPWISEDAALSISAFPQLLCLWPSEFCSSISSSEKPVHIGLLKVG